MTNTNKPTPSKVISFSIPEDLETRLNTLCTLSNQKRSTIIRNLLIQELKKQSLLDPDYNPIIKAGRPTLDK